jgi:hypothetical protein
MSALNFPDQVGQYNAQQQGNVAEATRATGLANEQQINTKAQMLAGAQTAAYGAGGVNPNKGTPLAVIAAGAGQGELQKRLAMFQAQSVAQQDVNKGALDRAQGRTQASAQWLQFGQTLLGTVQGAVESAIAYA